MDDLLKPVRTVTIRKNPHEDEATSNLQSIRKQDSPKVSSPENALKVLKNGPGPGELSTVLNYLKTTLHEKHGFNGSIPEPRTTQIIHVLVNNVIPSYWSTLTKKATISSNSDQSTLIKNALIKCLSSLPGTGSIIARLKLLTAEAGKDQTQKNAISETLDLLQEVLEVYDISNDIRTCGLYYNQDQTKRTLFWKEVVNLRASGRIVAIAAQAEDLVKESRVSSSPRWFVNGSQYAAWLGQQLGNAHSFINMDPRLWQAISVENLLAQFTGKSLNMGYPNDVIREFLKCVHTYKLPGSQKFGGLVKHLRIHEQRQFVDAALSILASHGTTEETNIEGVSGAAGLLASFIKGNDSMYDYLVERLVQEGPKFYDDSTFSLRIMLAVTSTTEERMQQVLEKSMKRFGDKLYIKHNPLLAQEALAQVLLISAGYVHRKQPMFLFTIARSGIHNASVSNRLAATSSRARFLGMVVGTAISQLVDKGGTQLKFDVEDLNTDEARWYQQLVVIEDEVGDNSCVSTFLQEKWPKPASTSKSQDLVPKISKRHSKENSRKRLVAETQETTMRKPEASKIQIIDDEDEDDLIPYAKPDSDPEDDDEDPTLVNRNRASAPVYIRDLIAALRDLENHDRHVLALRTAPSLIRRKANFGKEVSDHEIELANIFAGLSDHFELEDFAKLRLQCLVAVLVAQPKEMGRWFAKAFFEGDYSISQRGAVLSAMGLAARELAGLENGDDLTGPAKELRELFPSKKLPEKFHKLYGGNDDPVMSETKKLERRMMEPLALQAADKLSGPNALKVRTFSSRMEVDRRRKKPLTNELGKIVAESIFFPLTGRFQMTLQAYGGKSIQSSPHLLPLYLRTLTLVLHAAGPSSPSLPSMTSEFFDLLLNLRGHALQDDNVLEALLFALLTTLDLNAGEDATTDGGRRLCMEMGKEMLEMQGWVEGVFEKVNENDAIGLARAGKGSKEREGNEAERVGMLAAGVLTRIREIVGKFQRILMGDMVAL